MSSEPLLGDAPIPVTTLILLKVKLGVAASIAVCVELFTSMKVSAAALTTLEKIIITALVIGQLAGSVGQLILLNMWLNHNPNKMTPFTVLTMMSTFYCLFFGPMLIGWLATKRPCLKWLYRTPQPLLLCVATGFFNAANGVLLVNATPHTPEIYQAMLISTQMIWTFGLSQVFISMHRRGLFWVALSFILTAGGIMLGMSNAFDGKKMSYNQKWWTVIFALGIVPGALLNVLQGRMMQKFTHKKHEEEIAEGVLSPITGAAVLAADEDPTRKGDDATVKITLLFFGCVSQLVFMFVFFPLDAAPWFGTSPTLAASRDALTEGWKCVLYECDGNLTYAILFGLAYILVYVTAVYLNHYSPTLCAIIQQVGSPLTALVLIIIPSWNVNKAAYVVGPSIGAVILITLGAVIYVGWEEAMKHRSKKEMLVTGAACAEASVNSGKYVEGVV